ncbi:MAG: hypothetical protein AseanaTS_12240 [Candidatus Pelagadaptatus aseana]|uniref:DUF4892 domain-containing protein n=1 Tax=Candidatus Pelagadaptatus aseana TaxID=3120508 RepID=UPI0039B1DB59
MLRVLRWFTVFAGLGFVGQAGALPIADYPHANTIYESSLQLDDYRLALGAMEKINNRWNPEREQRLSGSLLKKTYAIDEGHTASEVFAYLLQQVKQLGGRELFACEGRTCGSSNSWANNHFQVKLLYGLDDRQEYSALEVDHGNAMRSYVVIYAVTRGNKRNYVQLEVIKTRQQLDLHSSSEVITNELKKGNSFVLPGLQWEGDQPVLADAHAKSLVNVIRLQRGSRFFVVGHDFGRGGEVTRQQRSLQYAEAIMNQLQSLGVDASRLSAYGVGGLAPGERGQKSDSRMITVLRAVD